MLPLILQIFPPKKTSSHISLRATLQLTAPNSSTERVKSSLPCVFFYFHLRKSNQSTTNSKALVVSTDCYSVKARFWVRSDDAERKKSIGLFLVPLSPKKPLAVVQYHSGRWAGKCGRNWNGDQLGNEDSTALFFFCNRDTQHIGIQFWSYANKYDKSGAGTETTSP